ncbi:hypothetical protein [Thiothrix lacustris]|uniref:hypothetical protein n=1 Tax=Thiothrix lacustris TaxID=525917 RepID=UPI0012EC3013|nr:hypothetical protein [Thiothrix lacustris]
MKLPSSHTFVYCLLAGLVILSLHGCDKRNETPPPPQAEPVLIPQADQLKPASTSMDTTAPAANTTAIAMQPSPPPATTEPNAMPISPTKLDKPNALKIPNIAQQSLPGSEFSLRFLATGESFYTEIKLTHGILNYTYFEDTTGRCEKWIKNSPCWEKNDLKTISMALPNADLDNLYSIVKKSGVLALKHETFGGAKTGQRHYTQRLDISIDGQQKQLLYQSFPGASKKPEAFAMLETALLEYARDLPH